jgi:hypothetical protein
MNADPLARLDYVQLARRARRAQAIYLADCIAALFAAIVNALQKERGRPSTCSAT